MTRDEFKKVLDKRGYKWREEGEWIVVEEPGKVDLRSIKLTIPDNVRFNNEGFVDLESLKSIPDNVQFNNEGFVDLESLKSISDNIKFRNRGDVYLNSLESIPDNFQFYNRESIRLKSLKSMGNNVQFNNGDYVNFEYLKSIPINSDSDEMFPKCKDIRINGEWLDLEIGIAFPDSRWKSVNTGKVQMYESWVKNNY